MVIKGNITREEKEMLFGSGALCTEVSEKHE